VTGTGSGALDFFDLCNAPNTVNTRLTEQMIEKWWSIGDGRNREGMWVQGARLL
jgi:guanine deaminase